jgi:hypothetical protein
VEVGLEGVLGALLQVVVLSDELLELGLDVDNLLSRELELDDGDTSGLEVGQEADFVGLLDMLVNQGRTAMRLEMSLPEGKASCGPWHRNLALFVRHGECSHECCPGGQTGQ